MIFAGIRRIPRFALSLSQRTKRFGEDPAYRGEKVVTLEGVVRVEVIQANGGSFPDYGSERLQPQKLTHHVGRKAVSEMPSAQKQTVPQPQTTSRVGEARNCRG